MSNVHVNLAALGLELPRPPAARGAYDPVLISGDLAFLSGQVSREGDATIRGPVEDVSPQMVVRAGRACVLRSLSVLQAAIGDLDRVEAVLRMTGFVLCRTAAPPLSATLDAASDTLRIAFGERGRHARSAIGVAGLPDGGLLEIELAFRLRPQGSSQ